MLAQWAGEDIGQVLRQVGQSLRQFHDIDPDGCPWARRAEDLVAAATARVEHDEVDVASFDPPFRRYAPAELLALVMQSIPPAAARPVVIHGSARLAALRVEGGQLRWAELDGSGLGDPYRDLATLAIDLAEAVSPQALVPFFDAYGVDHPDVVRLDWHVLVDQLLR